MTAVRGNAAPWTAKRVADWLDGLAKTSGPSEHPEAGEKQSNHLAEGSVDILKRLIRIQKSSTESNLKRTIGPSHPLIPTDH